LVHQLLETTGIKLDEGGRIRELTQFQEHFKEHQIVIFSGLYFEDVLFDGQVESEKRINLLYDDTTYYYHVITYITGTMAKTYVCKGCNKGCKRDVTYKCEQSCSDCMSVPPCAFYDVRIPCESCSRNFRSPTYFDKHKKKELRGKTVCEQKRNCVSCSRSREKSMDVSDRTVRTVTRTDRLGISATCRR